MPVSVCVSKLRLPASELSHIKARRAKSRPLGLPHTGPDKEMPALPVMLTLEELP